MKKPIYLDYHATTPVDPSVLEAMLPYFSDDFGNSASDHHYGIKAKRAIDNARKQIADLINAKPDEIIFTSGATESDNTALFGVAEKFKDKGDHIITCKTEHKAVLDVCKKLESMGKEVTYLNVDKYGVVGLDELKDSITERTVLVSIMAANNEIGTIAPLREIGKIARENDVLFHTDAAQAVGHIPIDVNKMDIDLMSISAHKMYGPKGIGALYVKGVPKTKVNPIIYGGGHERGIRSGTLNVPAIVGFGKACEIAKKELKSEYDRLSSLRDKLLDSLKKEFPEIELNGHPTQRLPHNLNIYIPGINSKALQNITKDEVSFSTGSACTTHETKPSHVLAALGYDEERSKSSIRMGLGKSINNDEIDFIANKIIESVNSLKRLK